MGSTLGIHAVPEEQDEHLNDDYIEVYIIFKTRPGFFGKYYTIAAAFVHQICLLKSGDKFYYTDLTADSVSGKRSKNGKINLRFEEFKYLRIPYKNTIISPHSFFRCERISYEPVGRTSRTLHEIEQEFNQRKTTINQEYSLWTNNCQHYVHSVISYLQILNPSQSSNRKVYVAANPFEITLHPNPNDYEYIYKNIFE
jgi:hypothetical protein